MGQICPVLLTRIWTCPLDWKITIHSNFDLVFFKTILTYIIMLENCQNNISVYDCSPIQGTKSYSC